MKSKSILVIILILVVSCLCGCNSQKPVTTPITNELNIYTTIYPFYAFTEMLLENVADVQAHCLTQPQDGCIRNYSLSDWDLALLQNSADVIISGGKGLESYEDILYSLGESGPVVAALLYDVDLSSQKAINTTVDSNSHWLGENPHIYLSIRGAQELTHRTAYVLTLLDPDHESLYQKNLNAALQKFESLQKEIDEALDAFRDRKVIIMNEALVYVEDAYGVDIDLCYERESGEDLSGIALENCLKVLAKSDAKVILLEKQAPQSLRKSLEDEGYTVALMDIFSTRRADEGAEGYFSAQRENIHALQSAFKQAK